MSVCGCELKSRIPFVTVLGKILAHKLSDEELERTNGSLSNSKNECRAVAPKFPAGKLTHSHPHLTKLSFTAHSCSLIQVMCFGGRVLTVQTMITSSSIQ